MLVWTNFSLHYQSSIGFLCIPHKTYNSIILCILRMREIMKEGNRKKYDDAGEAMNTICEEIKNRFFYFRYIE